MKRNVDVNAEKLIGEKENANTTKQQVLDEIQCPRVLSARKKLIRRRSRRLVQQRFFQEDLKEIKSGAANEDAL